MTQEEWLKSEIIRLTADLAAEKRRAEAAVKDLRDIRSCSHCKHCKNGDVGIDDACVKCNSEPGYHPYWEWYELGGANKDAPTGAESE